MEGENDGVVVVGWCEGKTVVGVNEGEIVGKVVVGKNEGGIVGFNVDGICVGPSDGTCELDNNIVSHKFNIQKI